jgi:hypothetical protein
LIENTWAVFKKGARKKLCAYAYYIHTGARHVFFPVVINPLKIALRIFRANFYQYIYIFCAHEYLGRLSCSPEGDALPEHAVDHGVHVHPHEELRQGQDEGAIDGD